MSSGKLFKLFLIILSVAVFSQTALSDDGREDNLPGFMGNYPTVVFRGTSENLKIRYVYDDGIENPFGAPEYTIKLKDKEKTELFYNHSDPMTFIAGVNPYHNEARFFDLPQGFSFLTNPVDRAFPIYFEADNLKVYFRYNINGVDHEVEVNDSSWSYFSMPSKGTINLRYEKYKIDMQLDTSVNNFDSGEESRELDKGDYILVKLPEQDQFEGQSEMQKLKLEFLEGSNQIIPLTNNDMIWLCVENQGFSKTVANSDFPDSMNFTPPQGEQKRVYKVLRGKSGESQPENRYRDVTRVTINAYDAEFYIKTAEGKEELIPNTDEVFLQQPCNKIIVRAPVEASLPQDEPGEPNGDATPEDPGEPADGSTANGSNSFGNIVGGINPADSYGLGGNGCSLQKGTYTHHGSAGMLALLGLVVTLIVIPMRKKHTH